MRQAVSVPQIREGREDVDVERDPIRRAAGGDSRTSYQEGHVYALLVGSPLASSYPVLAVVLAVV